MMLSCQRLRPLRTAESDAEKLAELGAASKENRPETEVLLAIHRV